MKKDSRLSTVLHILLHMHFHAKPMTSEHLSRCAGTHPVVIRRLMGLLREQHMVSSVAGHGGGWSLTDKVAGLTLLDLHELLGEPTIFAIGNRSEQPDCLIEQAVNAAMSDAFDEAEALLLAQFGRISLGELLADAEKRKSEVKNEL